MRHGWRWVAVALAGATAACGSGGAPGSRAPTTATWDDDRATCVRALRIRVNGTPGATVTVLGNSEVIGDRGFVDIALPAATVGDSSSLRATIEDGGTPRVEEVRVLDPPRWPLDRRVIAPDRAVLSGKVHVISGDRRTTYPVKAALGSDGTLAIPLPCSAIGGRADLGQFRVTDSGPALVVPAQEMLLSKSAIADAEPVSLSGRVDLSRGTTAEVTVTGSIDGNVILDRYRAAGSAPVSWAPLYKKRAHQPVLVFFPDRTSFQMVGRAKLRDVAAVAIVTPRLTPIGTCGPYDRPGADPIASVPRFRTDADIAIVAAQTGASIASVAVEGPKVKKCPAAMTTDGVEEPAAVHPLPWGKIRLAIREATP